jgi:two-component sensor histidine kinase
MHHRVKNSLQLVQGLLLLQARGEEAALAEKLRDAAGRIVSIAAVHQRLYEGGAEARQEVADHLAGLVGEIGRSVGGERRVALEAAPGLTLPPEGIVPLGLLATELVTNALKHGRGTVTLRLAHGAGRAVLAVGDEGPGFPDGFDPAASRGLGMRVALAMARQLRGTLAVEAGAGGRVVVEFPTPSPSSPTPADPAASR